MKAMTLTRFGLGHLDPVETARPAPGPADVLVKVLACGVCRTDLHVIDGELPHPAIPRWFRVMKSSAESRRSVAR